MIITLKGATGDKNFSASNIGSLTTWRIYTVCGIGASGTDVSSVNRGDPYSGTITIGTGYDVGSAGISVTMGGQNISDNEGVVTRVDNTITISIASVTGTVHINVPTKNIATGEEDFGGEGNGVWLSELITGDSNAHSAFMAVANRNATLSTTPDYIYHTSEIQALLSGKTITRVACANLAPGTSVTFYSNPWSTGALTKDGRTEIGTITGSASESAAGSSMATYTISASIKKGESLAFKASSGVKMVEYGQLDFVTPVKYAYDKDTYDSALNEFIAFDFYLEG